MLLKVKGKGSQPRVFTVLSCTQLRYTSECALCDYGDLRAESTTTSCRTLLLLH